MKRKQLTLKEASHKKEKKKKSKIFQRVKFKKRKGPKKKQHFRQRTAPSPLTSFIQSNNTSLVYYTFAAFNLFSNL